MASYILGIIIVFLFSASALVTPRDNTTIPLHLQGQTNDLAAFAPDDFQICDYTASYNTLSDLNAAIAGKSNSAGGTMRSDCIAAYILDTLINMLDVAYNNYTVVNKGYDEEFDFYIKYMKKVVPSVLDNSFMFDTSNETPTEAIPPMGPGMKYFECKTANSDGGSFQCNDMTSVSHFMEMANNPTTLTLKEQDNYTAALTRAGITPDWVHFADHEIDKDLTSGRGGRNFQYHFHGYPVAKDNMVVPNPKDIVTKALPSIPKLRREMLATYLDIIVGNWFGGSTSDAAAAYATPVFMLMQAVDGMAQAKALGKQEQQNEEKQKENFIIMIVSVVLLFVPVIGEEAAAAAGLAGLARAIAIAGELGNGALGIYDSVKNPASAVVNILGMLLGVGAIAKVSRDGKGLAQVAKVRREMSADTIAGLGSVFAKHNNELNTISKFCKWK